MTASITGGLTGYRGRSGPASLHRGQGVFDIAADISGPGISEATMLVVELDVEDYIDLRLYETTIEDQDDPADVLAVGAEPYADTISTGLTAYDDTDGRTSDRSQNIGSGGSSGRLRVYNTPAGPAGPNWSISPGWPTPPSSGNIEWYAHAFGVAGFTDGVAPSGTICRVRAAISVQIVGTAEFTTDAEAPSVAWDPDPMWDLQDCLVVRGVIVPRDYEDQGLAITAPIDTWAWSSPTRPRSPTVVTNETPGVAEVDGAYSGTLNGTDVTSVASFYVSAQPSEEVVVWSVVLGFGIPDEIVTPPTSGAEPFEFTHRWPQMGPMLTEAPAQAADLLERHDQELEEHFATHGCGTFEYTFRWPTFYHEVLAARDDPARAMRVIDILERRDQELEEASAHQGEGTGQQNDGSCAIELTHRWREIMPLLSAGDARAWDLLEDRDREIEAARSACACVPEGGGET